MAPKRRPPPPAAKNLKKKSKVPVYESFEEALDAGVIQEEKGERYRTGDKAMRFYEEARKLYELAITFDPKAYEGHYNLGRTLFHLATNFLLPPSCLDLLLESIAQYRLALACTQDAQLQCDATFNMSESLLSLADIVEDDQGGDAAAVEGWRKEAADLLLTTSIKQEELLAQERTETEEEGQQDLGESMDEDEPVVAEQEEDGDVGGDDGDGGVPRAWEQTVTTPSVLLDTLLLLVSTLLLLPATPTTTQAIESAMNKCQTLAQIARSTTAARRDLDVAVAYASVWMSRLGSGSDLSMDSSGSQAPSVIDMLDANWKGVKDAPLGVDGLDKEIKVGLVCGLGDAQSSLAMALMKQQISSPTSGDLGLRLWTLLSASTQASTAALAILTPPPSPFPSSVVPDPSSATILLTLSNLSLQRAKLALPPVSFAPAEKNRPQLLTNALTYARRAAEASNTSLQAVLPPFPATLTYTSKPKFVDGGWEAESTGRDAVMQSLRVLFFQGGQQAIIRQVLAKAKGRLVAGDIARYTAGLVEDEVEVSAEEQAFWSEIVLAM